MTAALAEVRGRLRRDRLASQLDIGGLSESETAELVRLRAGVGPARAFAHALYEETEGNPFFTKELIRSLVESGDISRDDTGAWSFSTEAEISAEALPATIQQAVEKRIERLPEELRELLSIASVFGKTFDARDLETLAEDTRGIEDSIDRLILEGILEEERESRGDRLTFASGIVRDVLPSGQIQTIEGNYENKVTANVRSPTEATGYVNMSE